MLVAMLTGCDEKPKTVAPSKGDKAAEKKSASDAKLEAAMAAASAAAGQGKKAAAQEGPPPNGIFDPGAADKVMPLGAEPKVEMASDGAEPRVALLSSAASWKGSSVITTGVRLGPRNALPSIEFTAALGPEKKDKKDAKDAKDAPPPNALLALLGDVTAAKLSADQPGKLPEGLNKEIAKLKGSQLRWKSSDLGVAREPSAVISKEAPADLQRSLDAAAEAMFYLSVPPPPKPVGVGAAWIAGSRQVISGIEVVSYRLYKVKSVSPEGVQLTLESHEFSVRDTLDMPGLPKGATLGQFEATTQGEIELPARESLGSKGKIARQVTLGIKAENAPPGAMMSLQIATEATVARAAK